MIKAKTVSREEAFAGGADGLAMLVDAEAHHGYIYRIEGPAVWVVAAGVTITNERWAKAAGTLFVGYWFVKYVCPECNTLTYDIVSTRDRKPDEPYQSMCSHCETMHQVELVHVEEM